MYESNQKVMNITYAVFISIYYVLVFFEPFFEKLLLLEGFFKGRFILLQCILFKFIVFKMKVNASKSQSLATKAHNFTHNF